MPDTVKSKLKLVRRAIEPGYGLWVFPGAAILTTVLAINFVGDWLRDVVDPRAPW